MSGSLGKQAATAAARERGRLAWDRGATPARLLAGAGGAVREGGVRRENETVKRAWPGLILARAATESGGGRDFRASA